MLDARLKLQSDMQKLICLMEKEMFSLYPCFIIHLEYSTSRPKTDYKLLARGIPSQRATPSHRIDKRGTNLLNKQLAEAFKCYPGANDKVKVRVEGFDFPLNDERDIERLEQSVRNDRLLKQKYIDYLATKKPPAVDLVDGFSLFFTDASMVNYNWNGISSHRFPKKAMKNYQIFTFCMLEAWPGLNSERLASKMKRAIEKINNRRNVQHSKRRRKARINSLVENFEIL
ncbi:uncharacterized protein LOC129746293 [Uranotaenia lowii]|uniref:uncharacterized protein LOC129746293 n=1 Tax=Uranotaenia lowii TaxID=190385 RepID=UPI002479526A|nr:uncharacterized protein LOC129746293 [Uranotaenia lowii]XP_055595885.1 uncharacterized protein LOC129746293 [Uranotaenia lowii]